VSIWLEEFKKGLLELYVLNLLGSGRKRCDEVFQSLILFGKLNVGDSNLYPLLVELKKDKKITIHAEEDAAAPPKYFFSLTTLGRRHLHEMNDYWNNVSDDIGQFIKESCGEMQ